MQQKRFRKKLHPQQQSHFNTCKITKTKPARHHIEKRITHIAYHPQKIANMAKMLPPYHFSNGPTLTITCMPFYIKTIFVITNDVKYFNLSIMLLDIMPFNFLLSIACRLDY